MQPGIEEPPEVFDCLSILLAEDTLANQKVIESILVTRGHQVIVSNNGQEAMDQISSRQFDAVIMDVQMPVMNGYETTAAIRRLERQTLHHVPIIALTAHSTDSDREACLQAGMDAFLTKPINVSELVRITESTVKQVRSSTTGQLRNSTPNDQVAAENVIDRDSIMQRLGGDEELLRSFIEVFFEDSPELMQQLRFAIAEHDANLLQRSAHSLRGLAANFSAAAVVELASGLEKAGKDNDLSEANSLLTQLTDAMHLLHETLAAYQS
jgi:two-component system, sensor histidine kinase and response regulator